MSKKASLLMGLVIVLLMGTVNLASATSFTDIQGNPHEDAIVEMARLGILEGVGNNQFAPNAQLNRAAAAKVAGFLLGYSEEDALAAAQTDARFIDIMGTPHQWAVGWINLMAEDGILQGVGDNRYAPEEPL